MIKEFQGPYRWLSNFASVFVTLDGMIFPSVEHAYMAAKSDNHGWRHFCATTRYAGEVKKASRKVTLIPNWNQHKFSVMQGLLEQKFTQEPYKTLLDETGSVHIQEGNLWNDRIWGVCLRTGLGDNRLGKMIMKIRENNRIDEE